MSHVNARARGDRRRHERLAPGDDTCLLPDFTDALPASGDPPRATELPATSL